MDTHIVRLKKTFTKHNISIVDLSDFFGISPSACHQFLNQKAKPKNTIRKMRILAKGLTNGR